MRYPAKNLTTVATCLKADFMNSAWAKPVQQCRAGAETLRLQITYSVGGASDRKMSLGFYCLPDVMSSWLYPISIVDILKSIKTCGFSGTFFYLSKER